MDSPMLPLNDGPMVISKLSRRSDLYKAPIPIPMEILDSVDKLPPPSPPKDWSD